MIKKAGISMKYHELKINKTFCKVIALIAMCFVLGQSSAQYQISKYSINNGGGVVNGNTYQVTSSIGQKESTTTSTGGGFQLSSGFWAVG
jgi:hypothetical protein